MLQPLFDLPIKEMSPDELEIAISYLLASVPQNQRRALVDRILKGLK